MAMKNSAGAQLNKAGVEALAPQDAVPVATRTFTQDVYQTIGTDGEAQHGSRQVLKFKAGQTVKQSEIDALFVAGTATSISPSSGPVAGGTNVTITGTNLDGVTGVTIGVACTNVKVVSSTKVTATTGATTAGAKAVSLADDAGTINMTGTPFTYV